MPGTRMLDDERPQDEELLDDVNGLAIPAPIESLTQTYDESWDPQPEFD